MRLYTRKIDTIAEEMLKTLREEEAIDVDDQLAPEAILDVQGVLREYIRTDRKLTNKARELSEKGRGSFSRIKRQLSIRNNFKVGDEGIDYIVDQLIETFLHSHHIEEIYADDRELRRTISTIIKKHTKDCRVPHPFALT
jgi:hypothetical protein